MSASQVAVSVIVENTAARTDLKAEHGLSLWIETSDARVLFDTGQGEAFPHNADALGIPLDRAEAIVLSHGHYDHTGGLAHALDRNRGARVFMHPDATRTRYSRHADKTMHSIGMPAAARESLDAASARVVRVSGPADVAPGIRVTGPIPRANRFEDTGGDFFLDSAATMKDPILDDQAAWVETGRGIVVILGCAHSGVVNTLDYIAQRTGASEFHAVIGGMHLGRASDERIAATADAFRKYRVAVIRPAHCTGATATAALARLLPGVVEPCSAGRRLLW